MKVKVLFHGWDAVDEIDADVWQLVKHGIIDVPNDVDGEKEEGFSDLTGLFSEVVKCDVYPDGNVHAEPVKVRIDNYCLASIIYGEFTEV